MYLFIVCIEFLAYFTVEKLRDCKRRRMLAYNIQMPRNRTHDTKSRKNRCVKKRVSFRRSNKPPRRQDIVKGGTHGAVPFPATAGSVQYNAVGTDPNRFGVSASNLPDMKGGKFKSSKFKSAKSKSSKSKRSSRKQRGGSFLAGYTNSLNNITNLTNSAAQHHGLNNFSLTTDSTGVSNLSNLVLGGPQNQSLTNRFPPIA